uniref:Uncharacterized protein n=1 Tax=Pararge aegeria TaxID=116150 RepID=S4P2P0_9NEOP
MPLYPRRSQGHSWVDIRKVFRERVVAEIVLVAGRLVAEHALVAVIAMVALLVARRHVVAVLVTELVAWIV